MCELKRDPESKSYINIDVGKVPRIQSRVTYVIRCLFPRFTVQISKTTRVREVTQMTVTQMTFFCLSGCV